MSSDLFPGYSRSSVQVSGTVSIFTRLSPDTSKSPLLLLHGFPQTHVEFHKIAPELARHFTLILMDLRGYGESSIVSSTGGSGMSKRIMAEDCIAVMKHFGYDKFSVLGHDRGARVAYRLAFDAPQHLDKVALVDIIPTSAMYQGFGKVPSGLRGYHWLFLAQAEPFPETMIEAADKGEYFLRHTLATWTRKQDLSDFGDTALEAYKTAFCDPTRIHMLCEDYRAGALIDNMYDLEELESGRKIDVPILAVWGDTGLFAGQMNASFEGPLTIWQKYCHNVIGTAIPCGHFVPEEEPDALLQAVLPFLK
ncbi:hypothetical protein KCU67_g4525, partial [Aureobasidium melanogenum]